MSDNKGLTRRTQYVSFEQLEDFKRQHGALKGDPGKDGEDGRTGPQGERGLKGERGEKGDIGETGRKGTTGDQGPAGRDGCRGLKGDTGCQGKKGEQGDRGERGDTGSSGCEGTNGEPGAAGAQGEKGDTGAQGEPGAKGDTGATGEAGAPGAQGAPGTAGATGAPGAAGAQGEKGEKGDKGDTGETGAMGLTGAKGDDGAVGEKGEKGDTGNMGDMGVAGLSGGIPGCDNADATVINLTVDLQDGNGPQTYCTLNKDGVNTDTNFFIVSAECLPAVNPGTLGATLPINLNLNNGDVVSLVLEAAKFADFLGAYLGGTGTAGVSESRATELANQAITAASSTDLVTTAAQAKVIAQQCIDDNPGGTGGISATEAQTIANQAITAASNTDTITTAVQAKAIAQQCIDDNPGGTGGITATEAQTIADNAITAASGTDLVTTAAQAKAIAQQCIEDNPSTGGVTLAQVTTEAERLLDANISCVTQPDPANPCAEQVLLTVKGVPKALEPYVAPETCSTYCMKVEAGTQIEVSLEANTGYKVYWGENDQVAQGTGAANSSVIYTYLTAGTYKLRVCLDEYCDSAGNINEPTFYSVDGPYTAIDETCS